jgi:3-oxoacyl-[acyl-carrier protein] reductase
MIFLITGGSNGLGRAIVNDLAQDQAHTIYFTYRSSVNNANELESAYKNVKKVFCDFSDAGSVTALLKEIENVDIDVLINNAATKFTPTHAHKIDPAELTRSFEENVIATVRITQFLIKTFRLKKKGKIINILSSAIGSAPPIGWAAYIANKNYLLSMSNSWATENIRYGITSNCISPSFMRTGFNSETDERVIEDMMAKHPLNKLLTTDDVLPLVHYMIEASSFLNGQHVILDAGSSL